LAKLSRKIARKLAERKRKTFNVNGSNLEKLLGIKKRLPEKIREKDEVGVATGLAWTSIGGVTLEIEVNIMPGTGKIELTGSLGSVMKESALAAISFIRSRVDELGIDKDFYSTKDIHIHVPEGATPKDGPSAGITLATAMVSALTGCPCKKSVAMTGEITLRGRILPIGGVKEKILAAHRAGIKTVIIPEDNKKDLEEIPANVRRGMRFVTVASMDTVLLTALKNFNFSKSGMLLAAQNNSSDLAVTDIM
jgi:ATP-dependent Lon protease